jgi:TonB family protein
LILLALLVKKYGITTYKGLKLVLVEEEYVPFSVFNLIFVQRKHYKKEGFDRIIEHERVHVHQHHTLDLLLLESLIILQWFNPFLWLVKGSLKSVHEYLADQKVLSRGHDPRAYKLLLLNQTFGVQYITLSNNLNQSLTKRRFIMMSKKRNTGLSMIRMVLIFPAAMAIAVLFTLHSGEQLLAQQQDLVVHDATLTTSKAMTQNKPVSQQEPVYTVVEQMPAFPGGNEALVNFMVNNVKYPENARKNGIQGTVYVTFVVEKDGSISNARVLRGVDKELDEEAVRVVNAMPKWKPGKEKGKAVKVQFNLPVAYRLDSGDEKKTPKETSTPEGFLDVKKGEKK